MTAGEAWRQRFRHSAVAAVALAYVSVVAVIALLAPLLASSHPLLLRVPDGSLQMPAAAEFFGEREGSVAADRGETLLRAPVHYSPNAVDVTHRLEPPSSEHRFGTDDLGRDVLARIVHGARVSLTVGLVATAISLVFGSLLGAIAGYYGGAIDWVVSRAIELVLCFPLLFLILGIVALFRPSKATIIIAIAVTSWTGAARFVRGEVLRVRELDFAHAARAIGARDPRLIFRHLLPNALAPALVSASFGVADAVLTESALSFIGLGVPLPAASWGSILSNAEVYIDFAWWLTLFPGIAIFTTVAAFNILGDRLREVLDPRNE